MNFARVAVFGVCGMALILSTNPARADSAVAWGGNDAGQLGDGTLILRRSPVAVIGMSSDVTAIAAGQFHSLAIQNGGVYAWGDDYFGNLGDGNDNSLGPGYSTTPVAASGLTIGVTAIAADGGASFAVQNGALYAWGSNSYGQLGTSSSDFINPTPAPVSGLTSGVTAVAAGAYHVLAVRNGALYTWGSNASGELGDGTRVDRSVPVQVLGMLGVTAVAAGGSEYYGGTSLAIKNGALYSWGLNTVSGSQRSTPAVVSSSLSSGVTAIAAGARHNLAVKNGNVYAWGKNILGVLGDGTITDSSSPKLIDPTDLNNIVAVAAGIDSSYALASDGSLWVWGSNFYGELGLGGGGSYRTPQHLLPPEGYVFTSIDADGSFTSNVFQHSISVVATLAAVPEPSGLVLITLGMSILAFRSRRRVARLIAQRQPIRLHSFPPNRAMKKSRRLAPLWAAFVALILPASSTRADENFQVLHSFDGYFSYGFAPLTPIGSKIYGVTQHGPYDSGAAFSMNLDGSDYQELHAFEFGGMYAFGYAGLTLAGSKLFGTAADGGAYNGGIIYSMNLDGTDYQVQHSFDSSGWEPHAGLTLAGSKLYGTASSGVAFSLNLDGTDYQVLHGFVGNDFGQGDGATPQADLTIIGSKIYGTTTAGGLDFGGTAFSMNLDGSSYRILHSFPGFGKNGTSNPSGLTIVGSTLYGTTTQGGGGSGTIFSMNLDGSNYQILHVFSESLGDAWAPRAGLTPIGSKLYGTTAGYPGAVFSINLDGSEYQIAHWFDSNTEGSTPEAELTLIGSTLFGTTSLGGLGGGGTLFAITVPEPPSVLLAAMGLVGLACWPTNFRKSKSRKVEELS